MRGVAVICREPDPAVSLDRAALQEGREFEACSCWKLDSAGSAAVSALPASSCLGRSLAEMQQQMQQRLSCCFCLEQPLHQLLGLAQNC